VSEASTAPTVSASSLSRVGGSRRRRPAGRKVVHQQVADPPGLVGTLQQAAYLRHHRQPGLQCVVPARHRTLGGTGRRHPVPELAVDPQRPLVQGAGTGRVGELAVPSSKDRPASTQCRAENRNDAGASGPRSPTARITR
jgi:hypothetical protein